MEGYRRLALFDKDSTGLNATKAAIKTVGGNANPDVFIIHVDNLDTYEVGKNMELAIRHFGRIDYAINCGGMSISCFTLTPTHNDSGMESTAQQRRVMKKPLKSSIMSSIPTSVVCGCLPEKN